MPSETRKLAFTEAELQTALVSYALRSDMDLPNANIDKVLVATGGETNVKLIYAASPGDTAREVEFSQEHVAASIILYCRSQSIPLPRDSRKILLAENGSVSMLMQVNYTMSNRPASTQAAVEVREDAESEIIASNQARAVDGSD